MLLAEEHSHFSETNLTTQYSSDISNRIPNIFSAHGFSVKVFDERTKSMLREASVSKNIKTKNH